jgi:phosphatidylglycerophosphatase C
MGLGRRFHEWTPVSGVAAFDFDGTITSRDTIWPFLRAVAGDAAIRRGLPGALPAIAALKLGLADSTTTKERLFAIYLRGRRLDEVRAAAARFAREEIPALVRPEALARIKWHLARGHSVVVVTASPELYVGAWAAPLGVEVVGSRLQVDAESRLTGRHDGPACDGAEKVLRLRTALGLGDADMYAYGDSSGDRELLAMARHAYWRTMPPSEEV